MGKDDLLVDPFAPVTEQKGLKYHPTKGLDELLSEGGEVLEDEAQLPAGASPEVRSQVKTSAKIRRLKAEGYEKPNIRTDYETGALELTPETISRKKKKDQEHLKAMRDQAWDQGVWPGILENFNQRVWWGEDVEGEYSAGPLGGVNLPFGDGNLAHFIKDVTWDKLKGWHKDSGESRRIYAKAQEQGYASLDDRERKHLQKQNLNRFVHGMTADGPWEATPQEITRLALEQEYYERVHAREIEQRKDPKVFPADIAYEDPTYIKRNYGIVPTGKRKEPHLFPITGLTDLFDLEAWGEEGQLKRYKKEWKEQAEELPPEAWERKFSTEERRQILGLQMEEEEERKWAKKWLKDVIHQETEFQSALDAAEKISIQNRGRRLTGPVRDLQGYSFLSRGSLAYDLAEMESYVIPQILEELLQKKYGPDYKKVAVGTEEEYREGYVDAVKQARQLWFEDRAMLLGVGRGLAFYDPDPGRTNEELTKKFRENFIETGLQEKLSQMGPGFGQFLGAPTGGRGLVSYADVVLPVMVAFTPRYSMHINSTHAEFTSHRLIDGLMGSDISNWLGAALKTYIEVKKGYGREGLPIPLVAEDSEGQIRTIPKHLQDAHRIRQQKIAIVRNDLRKWAHRNFEVALDEEDIIERIVAGDPELLLGNRALTTIRLANKGGVFAAPVMDEFKELQTEYKRLRSGMLDLTPHDPTAGVEVNIEKERALFFRSITEQQIREETGSESLVGAWKGLGGPDGGMQELLLPPGPFTGLASSLPRNAQQVGWAVDDLKMLGRSYEEFKTVQAGLGSPEVVDRYFHNLRKGVFLFQSYDDLARMYGESMDADPEDIKTLRKLGVLVGLTSMVAPGTGTDFVSPIFYPMAKGFKVARARYVGWRKDPKWLENIASKDLRADRKLDTIKARDPALGESIEQEIKLEGQFKGNVREGINTSEISAEVAERRSAIMHEEAGIYTSPEVLPGGRFQSADYRERWLLILKKRISARNPGVKITPEDLDRLALEEFQKYHTEIVNRITHSTVAGDVYELAGELHVKTPGGEWIRVADEGEIEKLRSYWQSTNQIHQPIRELTHHARAVWDEIPDASTKTGTRDELTGVVYDKRSTKDLLPVGFRSIDDWIVEPAFSRNIPHPELNPGVKWVEQFGEQARAQGRILQAEDMVGAQAWSVRDPHINPYPPAVGEGRIAAQSMADVAAGRKPQNLIHAQEEALRKDLAAKEMRATVTRADYDAHLAQTSDEFIHLKDLRTRYDELDAKIIEVKARTEGLDVAGTKEFEAWGEVALKHRQAEAATNRAQSAVSQKVPKVGDSGKSLSYLERRQIIKSRRARLKEAQKLEDQLGKQLNTLGKPIAKKQKLHQQGLAEMVGLVQEKMTMRTAMTGFMDSWGQAWTSPHYGWKGLSADFGEEMFDQLDEVIAFLGRTNVKATQLAGSAARRLDKHVKQHGSMYGGQVKRAGTEPAQYVSREMDQIVTSWQRAASAQATALVQRNKAEVTDRIIRKRAQQIREGTAALAGLSGLTGVVDSALVAATLSKPRGGGRVIDASLFMKDLVDKVGDQAIDHAIAVGGSAGTTLNRIREHVNRKWLPEGGLPSKKVILGPQELRDVQGLPGVLRNAFKETHKHRNSIAAVEALHLAWKDPDLKVAGIFQYIGRTSRKISTGFDPIKAKTGEMSEDLLQVAKYVEHAHGQVRDELDAMARHIDKLARKSKWTPEKRYEMLLRSYETYLTSNTPLQWMRARSTFFNEGPESIWKQAKWQMEHDPRSKTLVALRNEAEDSAEIWRAAEDTRRAGKGKVTQKELDDYVTATYGERLREIESVKGMPLRAISRAWIPEARFEGASLGQAARMYKKTYQALQNNSSLRGFLDEVIAASKQKDMWGRPTHDLKSLQHAAYAITHAAIQHRANDMVVRAVSGFATPESATNIARLFGNEAHKITDWAGMTRTLNQYGLPFTQQHLQRATGTSLLKMGEGVQTSKKLIATGVERVPGPKAVSIETGLPMPPEPGRTILMPESLAKTIDESMPKITKDLKRRFVEAKTPEELRKLGAQFDFNRLWKTSVVTGLYVPRPKYWWNNFIGDLSQMHFEHGFTTAVGVSTQLVTQQSFQLLSHIPGAKVARRWHNEMAKKFGGYENTLGSTWNAMWNPHANKIWRGEKGALRTRYGTEYSYAEVRKMMSEEGILDTMVHEELLRTFARHVPEQWTSKPFLPPGVRHVVDVAEESRYNISWLATHVQQRQRGNLFMELLRQGYRPKDAARKTIDALYDWKHGITRYEAMTIGKISPFYRFWKLAFGQMARKTMEPLIRPDKAMVDAMMGRTALSRVRQQLAAAEATPYLLDPEIASEWQDQEAIYNNAAKYYRPSWARSRGLTGVSPLDEISQEHYRRTRGRAYTHSMGINPPATVLDVSEIGASWAAGLAAWAVTLTNEERPGVTDAWRVSPDFSERWWQPTLQMMMPTLAGPLESILQESGIDTGGYKIGKATRVRPAEKYMLDNLGVATWYTGGATAGAIMGAAAKGVFGFGRIPFTLAGAAMGTLATVPYASTKVVPHPEYGYPMADAFAVGFLRLTPVLGNELPAVLDSAYTDNPYSRKMVEDGDPRAGLMIPAIRFGMKGFTGFGKQYPFNPEHAIDWRAKDVQEEAAKYRKEIEPTSRPTWKGYED